MSPWKTSEAAFDRNPLATRPSLILEVSSRAVFHAAMVFAIWLLAAGHNRPGGGFVGGLTIASALILTYASGGSKGLARALPMPPLTFIGIGMMLAQAAAILPLLLGGSVLQSAAFEYDLPLFGAVKLTTVLFFDIGVLLIVMGLVAKALDTLGGADPADVGDGPAAIAAAKRAANRTAAPTAGDGASDPAGDGASDPAGDGASDPAGDGASDPAGDGASDPAGDHVTHPGGHRATDSGADPVRKDIR